MRQLVTIQKIKQLRPIEGADAIEVATVLGWNVVVKKGEFKVGDYCVFFEIDSLLPEHPAYEFLAKNGKKKTIVEGKEYEGYRLRTVRLRGQISQGLALNIGSFADKLKIQDIWTEGHDVTEKLGVVKYEPPMPASMSGIAKGSFPSFIPKTDETRIQTIPWVLEKYKDQSWYITEKLDGTSCTVYFKDGEVNVCSRNINWKEESNNVYWQVVKEKPDRTQQRIVSLKKIVESHDPGLLAIQGEIVGEGIQGNKLKIKGHKFFVFNIYDLAEGRYWDYSKVELFCKFFDLDMVPVWAVNTNFHKKLGATVEDLVQFSIKKSLINPDVWVEGFVFRPMKEIIDQDLGRLSFKVINPEFLLSYGE